MSSLLHSDCQAFLAVTRSWHGTIYFEPKDGPYALVGGGELEGAARDFLKGICEKHHLKLGLIEFASIRRHKDPDERPRDTKGRFLCDLVLSSDTFEVDILVNASGWSSEVEWEHEQGCAYETG